MFHANGCCCVGLNKCYSPTAPSSAAQRCHLSGHSAESCRFASTTMPKRTTSNGAARCRMFAAHSRTLPNHCAAKRCVGHGSVVGDERKRYGRPTSLRGECFCHIFRNSGGNEECTISGTVECASCEQSQMSAPRTDNFKLQRARSTFVMLGRTPRSSASVGARLLYVCVCVCQTERRESDAAHKASYLVQPYP